MTNKIVEIWKEIIYLSAKYTNYTEEEKSKLIKKFKEYKKILNKDDSEYSNTVNLFLIDLQADLEAGRKLQIDSIEHDDYLENYFISQREINHYNSLINEDLYISIFNEINWDKNYKIIDKLVDDLSENFLKEVLLISAEKISKNLLIFTLFEKKLVSKALRNLYKYLYSIPQSKNSLIKLNLMIEKHNILIQKIYTHWIEYYNSDKFNIYYMKFVTIIIQWEKVKNLKKYNSSQMHFRTWNAKYEYKKILKKIIEY